MRAKMIETINKYCNSISNYSRFETREVKVGDLGIGGENPIRIQSMTTTDTMNTQATIEQSIRMIDVGCELVRITAPSIKEAQNLKEIKDGLLLRGYKTPIVADIHFTPNAAELAARIVEKVRVNPGNYADKKKFQQIEYSDTQYESEIQRIYERFSPLVKICKEYGTAMRIGTNHGSLSDRIMSRYGDTPLGMVESALEFLRICEDLDYHEIILSMKASNTRVMVQAYRLLVQKMIEAGMNYPLHLGVTEAGDGEDGRIKSAVGIGTLLEDGIGDTIRVSLTEEPEAEIPVAFSLAERYLNRSGHKLVPEIETQTKDPYSYELRESFEVTSIGASNVPRVVADFSKLSGIDFATFRQIGYDYSADLDKWNYSEMCSDLIFLGENELNFDAPQNIKLIWNYKKWISLEDKTKGFPLFSFDEYLKNKSKSFVMNFVSIAIEDVFKSEFNLVANNEKVVFVLTTNNLHAMPEQRRVFYELLLRKVKNPVIIKRSYADLTVDDFQLFASTDLGGLLIDGFGDGVWAEINSVDLRKVNTVMFGILQAARVRISKTEYIACPSCGRTLFDLVEVTNLIRNRTDHLKGVKIGIMGCIVNGPGEMADADYGYVGSGVGKITLYRGKDVVRRNINSKHAVDELIEIIREDGNWREAN
ncbi:MAG: (E)-4-hydroxy-3-methylbut-2-enyl-diphosphate synthase [Melioribacteraceae bacterium]|nr:(E)-4-hydroxy-3-methylbut-2-enyl-diphosphate synthase [Melioribacteraceae bacterium]MCF8262939.1 (E)-4-hydroxy-3-methylbut-2-enyl-diphosphate synthase [Melioribacteraceae bacterium]